MPEESRVRNPPLHHLFYSLISVYYTFKSKSIWNDYVFIWRTYQCLPSQDRFSHFKTLIRPVADLSCQIGVK